MTSPLHPYNTIERARRWYHDNAGLEGEGATGRRHLGWVLEVIYEMQNRLRELEQREKFLTKGREDLELTVSALNESNMNKRELIHVLQEKLHNAYPLNPASSEPSEKG